MACINCFDESSNYYKELEGSVKNRYFTKTIKYFNI